MKPGIYENVPFDEYRGWKAFSKSMVPSTLKSGLHLKHYLDHGEEESDAMVMGNLVDTMLLEPDLFSKRYEIIPEFYPAEKGQSKPWSWNANFCKDWRRGLVNGVTAVKASQKTKAQTIVDRILNHPTASQWLDGAKRQVSLSWIDPETGVACMGRMDAYRTEERIIDLKMSASSHPRGFGITAYKFNYHVQGAMYHDGLLLATGCKVESQPTLPFSFIVAEDEEPHDIVCYDLGMESFEVGRVVYHEAIRKYKEIIESGEYNGYSNVAEELEIPMYARNSVMLEGIIL